MSKKNKAPINLGIGKNTTAKDNAKKWGSFGNRPGILSGDSPAFVPAFIPQTPAIQTKATETKAIQTHAIQTQAPVGQNIVARINAMGEYLRKISMDQNNEVILRSQKSAIAQPYISLLWAFLVRLIPELNIQGIGLVITGGYATFLRIQEYNLKTPTSGLFYNTDDVDIQLCNMPGYNRDVDEMRAAATATINKEFDKWNIEINGYPQKFLLYDRWRRMLPKTQEDLKADGNSGNISLNITGNFNNKWNIDGSPNIFRNKRNGGDYETICEITFSTNVCNGIEKDNIGYGQWRLPVFKTFKLIRNLMAASDNFDTRWKEQQKLANNNERATDNIFPEKIFGWWRQLSMLNLLSEAEIKKKKKKEKRNKKYGKKGRQNNKLRYPHKSSSHNTYNDSTGYQGKEENRRDFSGMGGRRGGRGGKKPRRRKTRRIKTRKKRKKRKTRKRRFGHKN